MNLACSSSLITINCYDDYYHSYIYIIINNDAAEIVIIITSSANALCNGYYIIHKGYIYV